MHDSSGGLNLLEALRFVIERLDGTAFAPFVNALLFLLLFALVFSAIAALIRPRERELMRRVLESTSRTLAESARYGQPLEAFRERTSPYADFGVALILLLVGLYSGLIATVALAFAFQKADWPIALGATLMIFVSVIYSRINLAAASRAWRTLQLRRNGRP